MPGAYLNHDTPEESNESSASADRGSLSRRELMKLALASGMKIGSLGGGVAKLASIVGGEECEIGSFNHISSVVRSGLYMQRQNLFYEQFVGNVKAFDAMTLPLHYLMGHLHNPGNSLNFSLSARETELLGEVLRRVHTTGVDAHLLCPEEWQSYLLEHKEELEEAPDKAKFLQSLKRRFGSEVKEVMFWDAADQLESVRSYRTKYFSVIDGWHAVFSRLPKLQAEKIDYDFIERHPEKLLDYQNQARESIEQEMSNLERPLHEQYPNLESVGVRGQTLALVATQERFLECQRNLSRLQDPLPIPIA